MMELAVTVKALRKSYGGREVLHGIDFCVRRGEIFALLGANGAGKTTTLECLEGIRRWDDGAVEVQGRRGVQLQSASLPANLRAGEAVELFARWANAPVDRGQLARLGVDAFLRRQYRELSTGQKRRLHLALALVGGPEVLFLDEPTAGLDVEGRAALHAEIQRLRGSGMTILMASHDMAEVEELCDSLAILKDGSIAFLGTAAELTGQWGGSRRLRMRFSAPPSLAGLAFCRLCGEEQGEMIFEADDLRAALAELAARAAESQVEIQNVTTEHASIEERFLDIAREETA
ncbi:ABC transporter ATP-binding protein [Anaerofilum hominis]|nr:ABC transporter ATP-binding protein [Anaerofilum hominis]